MQIRKYIEEICWAIALVMLFFSNPLPTGSLCLFKFAGFSSCLGCGLGHSMHEALHLQFEAAWKEHILGIPAVAVLICRILTTLIKYKKSLHGPTTAYDASGNSAR